MDLYRSGPVPKAYSNLDFVREGNGMFTDSSQDMGRIEFFQSVAKGEKCLSELDSEFCMVVKADVPSDVLSSKGKSEKLFKWKFYYYKPHDAFHSLSPGRPLPCEAVGLEEAGIERSFLSSLAAA